MPCLFCREEKTLTREHVLADWLADVMYPRNTVVTNEFIGTNTKTWNSRIFQHKLKGVCEDCNNGWMASLEGKMKPLFIKLISLEKVVLDEEIQNTLATWTQKTVLMLNQSVPGGLKITQDLFDEIYKNKLFSKKVLVSMGWRMRYGGSKSDPIARFTIRQVPSVDVPSSLLEQVNIMKDTGGFIWRSTFAIGPVIFDLAGHNMNLILNIDSHTQVLKVIRPYKEDIIWPFDWPIEAEGDLDALSKSI